MKKVRACWNRPDQIFWERKISKIFIEIFIEICMKIFMIEKSKFFIFIQMSMKISMRNSGFFRKWHVGESLVRAHNGKGHYFNAIYERFRTIPEELCRQKFRFRRENPIFMTVNIRFFGNFRNSTHKSRSDKKGRFGGVILAFPENHGCLRSRKWEFLDENETSVWTILRILSWNAHK